MFGLRLVLVAALLAFGSGCGNDDDVETSEDKSGLSVAGDGMPTVEDPYAPKLPAWDAKTVPAPRPLDGDLMEPLEPEGKCGLGYIKLYDPVRGEPIEVPIVVCE